MIEIGELVKNPYFLLALAYVGYGLSVLKQLIDARRNGASITCREYLMGHMLETTGAVLGVVVLWLAAAETGQLNVVAALGIGYTANSGIDVFVKGGRSAALMKKDDGSDSGT